jgi:organic hydroperoxide reductase OsmC/OhrA
MAATVTAEKGPDGIRIQSSHLAGVVEALENVDDAQLEDIVREVAQGCTISIAIRETVRITHDIKAHRAGGNLRRAGMAPE